MPAVMEAIDTMTTVEKFETMNYLWSSLYSSLPDAEPSVLSEWLAEAKRRREGIVAGKTRAIPTSDVMAEDADSPEWHYDILREREASLADGSARLLDWEDVKAELRARRSAAV